MIRRCLVALAFVCFVACGGGGGDEPAWTAVFEDEPASLLGIWGSSASDVWVVGGHELGGAPIVRHFDGSAWEDLDPGVTSVDLWWVFGFEGGPVFMGGSGGTILRYQDGEFETFETPGTGTVFGIWGAAPDDVWAVGGSLGGGGRGFAWHFDGSEWTDPDQVPASIRDGGTVFKVAGRASDDVWMVGLDGAMATTLHWNGTALDRSDIAVDGPMLSVACESERCIAVGSGNFDGVLYENTGASWESALPTGGPGLNGVAATEDLAYAVGRSGTVLSRSDAGWVVEDTGGVTTRNLHANWIDPEGGVWAVGGDYDSLPTTDGVLIYDGDGAVADLP